MLREVSNRYITSVKNGWQRRIGFRMLKKATSVTKKNNLSLKLIRNTVFDERIKNDAREGAITDKMLFLPNNCN